MENVKAFLAKVVTIYPINTSFDKREVGNTPVYNNNKEFTNEDIRLYGAITYAYEDEIITEDYAQPIDKNNFTLPIVGETVIILKIEGETYYLPFSSTPYPNYRETIRLKLAGKPVDNSLEETGAKDFNQQIATGGPDKTPPSTKETSGGYKINEKIKFLQPKNGDTILSGRVGNTIRFSEFFLTEDEKTSSPGIYIRNKQNAELDSKPIGTLIEEDINKDGTSIYITSNKIKVPFKETVSKTKTAFKGYPSSGDLKGDQLFINSDRIILSSKASEFIIFGKGNTGIITDGNFSIDAEQEVYIHNNKNITIHSKGSNQIFLNSDSGKVFIGKNSGVGQDGAAVQQMVLGGELIKILKDLISAILQQNYLTPSGPSKVGPENIAAFQSINSQLKTILSANNYLSKT